MEHIAKFKVVLIVELNIVWFTRNQICLKIDLLVNVGSRLRLICSIFTRIVLHGWAGLLSYFCANIFAEFLDIWQPSELLLVEIKLFCRIQTAIDLLQ